MFYVSCVSHASASVHCCLVVTYWERADLLALVGDRCLMYLLLSLVVSWVRCGTWLYRSLIFAVCLIFINSAFSKGDTVLAKLFVYQNKFISRKINIQSFTCLLKKKMLSEKYISLLNNKINKFFKKWSPVYNYFFPIVTEEWDFRYPC